LCLGLNLFMIFFPTFELEAVRVWLKNWKSAARQVRVNVRASQGYAEEDYVEGGYVEEDYVEGVYVVEVCV